MNSVLNIEISRLIPAEHLEGLALHLGNYNKEEKDIYARQFSEADYMWPHFM